MNKRMITARVSTKQNHGDNREENYDYQRNGFISGKDSLPYDVASDVTHDGVGYSVKSARFTLASANLIMGDTLSEKLDYYFARVHSDVFVYITKGYIAYEMNKSEFRKFLEVFSTLERESEKNGGGLKVRAKSESKKMLQWFEMACA